MDKVHKVRMGVGNGLRQDVWQEFQSRYGNVKMCEVYGSTEGNLCFMNHIGKIGTVGRSNFIYRVSALLTVTAKSRVACSSSATRRCYFIILMHHYTVQPT